MVCTAKDLLEWKDFPKGLRVLLLDKDLNYASEIRSKLEGLDYIVSTFCNEDEALSAVLSKYQAFHVAIVEVSTTDYNGSFKFLQIAKSLPTVMAAEVQCLTTTMKCIALGAVEVLNKPISEDKIQNIWQHVVHKAYNAEQIPGMFDDQDRSSGNDEYPAPATPQQDSPGRYEESKSVETTCYNAAPEAEQIKPEGLFKEENDSADGCKSESDTSPHHKNRPDHTSPVGENARMRATAAESHGPCLVKTNRKKMKVDWTVDLHKKFVQAVEQLGIDQAIPSRILELMKAEGLTRHNVASHLQKYRMHRRHNLPKREERRISPRLNDISYYYQYKPIMAYPPPSQTMWVQPGSYAVSLPGWTRSDPPYQTWPWKSYPVMQADAWGCPVTSLLHGSYSYYPKHSSGCYTGADGIGQNLEPISHYDHREDDVIDKIVKEAISKPWLPLPLGLKPPSMECVLFELSKQGISDIPPTSY